MMTKHLIAGGLAVALLVGMSAPAPAAQVDVASICTGNGPAAGIVTACTELLGTGKLDADSQVLAYFKRGTAEESQGLHDKAVADFTAGIAIKPNANIYFARAYSNEQLGQDAAAIADYTSAISLNPANAPALTRRGFAYLRTRDYPNALADFNAALGVDAAAPLAVYGRARAYVGLGKNDLAIADFTTLIAANSKDVDSYRSRAQEEFALEKWAAAAADYAQVLTLKPGDPYSLLWEHVALARSGAGDPNFATAVAALDQSSFEATVGNFYLGKLGQGNVFAAAGNGQMCAAEVFIGESHEIAKQHGTAVINFQTATNPASPMCSYGTFEYQVAISEMSR
jgi:tetratricopeptide (TPR) repeat protein